MIEIDAISVVRRSDTGEEAGDSNRAEEDDRASRAAGEDAGALYAFAAEAVRVGGVGFRHQCKEIGLKSHPRSITQIAMYTGYFLKLIHNDRYTRAFNNFSSRQKELFWRWQHSLLLINASLQTHFQTV